MSLPAASSGLQLNRQWAAVLGELQIGVAGPVFETWLRHTRALAFTSGRLTVEAPTAIICNHLDLQLRTVVLLAAAKKGLDVTHLEFVPRGADSSERGKALLPGRRSGRLTGSLGADLQLERYVRFEGNELGLQSALDLLRDDDQRPATVVLYGRAGLGKTHLLQGVCHRALAAGMRVAALSANDFTSRFTRALKVRELDQLQEELRSADLIAIDDFHQLAGREKTQEELADTVEAMSHMGGRMLFAGEAHPLEAGLGDRLGGRLMGGVVIEIEGLTALERRCFVQGYANRSGQPLPTWAVDRLAATAPCVRSLKGAAQSALQMLRANRLTPERLDAHLAAAAFVELARSGGQSPVELIARVAALFDVDAEGLAGRAPETRYHEPRAIVSLLLHRQGLSRPAIGAILGRRNPTTIRDLIVRGESLLADDPALAQRLGA